ncbi:NADP-dependent alcohol dehydrogenase [Dioszegia hungarica]|uniref:NADP-dependent alcohol dehydrogenase n=1 Tax=Dioszegia hungarica TaxID=4972 RepID=A0AA38LTB4_9TREE|nr:NADP-dependent alcohol dehydrogenase [Dioszegia hungarica]KAI9634513.1 NADP-dependent alcohol dehydrogenase [Dioszegia hungarica]
MSTTQTQRKFEGWAAMDENSVKGQMKWTEYEPKEFADDDVELEVQYCGICGSDLHTMSNGWGSAKDMYPQVVGHEIVGKVVRVGKDVKHLKEGDVAGVGAQCDSCLECDSCKKGEENYCSKGIVGTYCAKFSRTSSGSKSYGGYANFWRGPAHFTLPIPSNIDPAEAAPMMCGGVTVFAPLKQYGAGTTAKDVGVVGIGGLGHFAVLFATAMGANVTAISHSHKKDEDAKKLGAKKVIVTGDDVKAAFKGHERSLDLIIVSSNAPNMPFDAYLSLLRPHGHLVIVGVAEEGSLPNVHPFNLIMSNVHISGSLIGSVKDIAECLKFAGDHNIKAWVKRYPMKDANEAVVSMKAGDARYRYVLVNEEHGGKMNA